MSFGEWSTAAAPVINAAFIDIANANPAKAAKGKPLKKPALAPLAPLALANPLNADLNRYQQVWTEKWQAEQVLLNRRPGRWLINPDQLQAALQNAVDSWNYNLQESRTVADLMEFLSPDDMADNTAMTPAALALYCWTVWGGRRTP